MPLICRGKNIFPISGLTPRPTRFFCMLKVLELMRKVFFLHSAKYRNTSSLSSSSRAEERLLQKQRQHIRAHLRVTTKSLMRRCAEHKRSESIRLMKCFLLLSLLTRNSPDLIVIPSSRMVVDQGGSQL